MSRVASVLQDCITPAARKVDRAKGHSLDMGG